ncbi:MAG: hypothetical protein WBX09_21565 [Terracidiphilus sp.]
MRFSDRSIGAALAVLLAAGAHFRSFAQDAPAVAGNGPVAENAFLPDAPQPQAPAGQSDKNSNATNSQANKGVPPGQEQPKRILGIMPNYRAVSAGAIPPPPTPKVAFKVATDNSFDYSSFVFVGLTSLIAKGEDDHPDLGKGPVGYWAYAWRGFVDKTDGNYLVIWALPSVFHEDERFYAKGKGRKFYRGVYAASRVLITPNYHGRDTFNASEIFGRGVANAVSLTYYPSGDRTAADFAQKYGYAVLRDAATNAFREFWPDIATHVLRLHSKPTADQ